MHERCQSRVPPRGGAAVGGGPGGTHVEFDGSEPDARWEAWIYISFWGTHKLFSDTIRTQIFAFIFFSL